MTSRIPLTRRWFGSGSLTCSCWRRTDGAPQLTAEISAHELGVVVEISVESVRLSGVVEEDDHTIIRDDHHSARAELRVLGAKAERVRSVTNPALLLSQLPHGGTNRWP